LGPTKPENQSKYGGEVQLAAATRSEPEFEAIPIPARTSVVANSGDSISSIVHSSDPVAVEAFMRANGLTDSKIYAGERYVMPNNADSAASTGDMGQAAGHIWTPRVCQGLNDHFYLTFPYLMVHSLRKNGL
jgi:LysM repeat protein